MSPWFSACIKPTSTIEKIVDQNPNKGLLFLSWIYGLAHLLQMAQIYALSEKIKALYLIVGLIFLAPLWGYILFSVSASLLFITGKVIKGEGTFTECRAALAWASLPYIFSIAAWVILLLTFGKNIFSYFPGQESMSPSEISLLTLLLLLQVGAFVWSLVLVIYNLSAVQIFSPVQAIINVVLAIGLLIALMFIVYLMAVFAWIYLF